MSYFPVNSVKIANYTSLNHHVLEEEIARIRTDLLKEGLCALPQISGPYALALTFEDHVLVIDVTPDNGEAVGPMRIPLSPLKRTMKDYKIVVESYLDALKCADPSKVEAIDMGRRGLHNEAADLLQALAEQRTGFSCNHDMARHIISLIHLLKRW